MQTSSSHSHDLFTPLQPIESIPNWSWNHRVAGRNKGAMEIGGLLSGNGRHNANADSQLRHHMQQGYAMNHYALGHNAMADATQHYSMGHSPALGFPHLSHTQHPQMMPNINTNLTSDQSPVGVGAGSPKIKPEPATKNFTCSTCPKKFARRSDLARHERIHSGVKPHKCDYLNCGKTFIQRSALTVHSRVHTGEKPHHCEICRKPFSDSSSLARHRRTHSGKRPYKCPYVNCQKTFTRRTTLTRHQNGHSGTVEQAAAEVHAKTSISTTGQSFDDNQSEAQSSRTSSNSPRESSTTSPTEDLSQFPPQMHRQLSNIHYVSHGHNHNTAIPPHMRNEYSMTMNGRHTHDHIPTTSSNTTYPSIPSHNPHQHQLQMQRPSITSNPTPHTYGGPPQPLEPQPTNSNGSTTIPTTSDSPHLSAMAWPSPNGALPSPSNMDFSSYPDPAYNPHMFFPSNNIRRPQSTEPEDWSLRGRHHVNGIVNVNGNGHAHYGGHIQLGGEWNVGMQMNVPEVKPERAYAM